MKYANSFAPPAHSIMPIAEVAEELLAEAPKKALAKVSGSVCGVGEN